MGSRIKDIVAVMEALAPASLAEPWDNVGLLCGDFDAPVKRVMVSLEVTGAVVKEAADQKAELLIVHHPLIFQPLKNITGNSYEGPLLHSLILSGIALFCAHTNLDKAPGGVDDTLAHILGILNTRPLSVEQTPQYKGFGRIGQLAASKNIELYLKEIKAKLGITRIDIIGVTDKEIRTVASMAGAGGDYIGLAQALGAELYITGELKHHDAVEAFEKRMTIASVGHFASEHPAMDVLIDRLQNALNALQYKIEVIPSTIQCDPIWRI